MAREREDREDIARRWNRANKQVASVERDRTIKAAKHAIRAELRTAPSDDEYDAALAVYGAVTKYLRPAMDANILVPDKLPDAVADSSKDDNPHMAAAVEATGKLVVKIQTAKDKRLRDFPTIFSASHPVGVFEHAAHKVRSARLGRR